MSRVANGSSSVNSSNSPESQQAAIKNRIITHLNADHAFSLQIYLRHFCAVPEPQAVNAKITDITTDYMILESHVGRNVISFNPPMKTLMEARERVVAMHHEAMSALNLSETKIDTFMPPNKPWQIVTWIAAFLAFVTFPFRSQLPWESGSYISKVWSLGGLVPGMADITYKVNPLLLILMVVIHSIEAGIFARTRLRKHRVKLGSTIWYLWMFQVFIGGVVCFNRFDNLVAQTEAEKKKNQRH